MSISNPEYARTHDEAETERLKAEQGARSQLAQRAQLRDPVPQDQGPEHHGRVRFPAQPSLASLDRPEPAVLSPETISQFKSTLESAAKSPDINSRNEGVRRAANPVSSELVKHHGRHPRAEILQAAHAQLSRATHEVCHKLGLGPVSEAALTQTLDSALASKGFVRVTGAATSALIGMQHAMDRTFNDSMKSLAGHGVTREAFKESLDKFFAKHSGKVSALIQMAEHPEAFQRMAQIVAHSPSAFEAVFKAANDTELRHALGTVTLATGESLASLPGMRGIGSVAIVTGAVFDGQSHEEIGRHVFRAALAVAGGAMGGLAGGGVLSIGTGIVGAELGSKLADKVLEAYDGVFNSGHVAGQEKSQVKQGDLAHSEDVLRDKVRTAAAHEMDHVREMSHARKGA